MLAKEINSSMCSRSDDYSWIILKCTISHESSLNLKRGVQKAGRYLNLLKQRFSSHAKKAGLQVNELQFLFPVALVDAGVFTKPGEERWKWDGFLICCSAPTAALHSSPGSPEQRDAHLIVTIISPTKVPPGQRHYSREACGREK